jgi:hypothetical protein
LNGYPVFDGTSPAPTSIDASRSRSDDLVV